VIRLCAVLVALAMLVPFVPTPAAAQEAAIGRPASPRAGADAPHVPPTARPAATVIAESRLREMETLAKLSAEGRSLYDADAQKQTGYQYCSLAASLAARGEFRLAVREASKALFLGQSQGNEDLMAHAKRDLAVAYSYAGNLERAQQYAHEALAHTVRPQNRAAVHSRANKVLGDVALRRGDTRQAIAYYEKAVEFNDGVVRFFARASLASAYLAAGDPAKAGPAVKDAESYLDALDRGARRGGEAVLQRIRGNLALKEGKPAEAREIFGKLVEQSAGADQAYARYWALEGRARAQAMEGDTAAALRSYGEAMTAAEQVRAQFYTEEINAGVFGEMRQAYDEAVRLAMDANDPAAAWQASERGRGRALLDLVRNRVQLASGSNVFIDPLGSVIGLADLQTLLKPGEALVEYHVLPARTYVWVIRRDRIASAAIDVKRDELAARVETFRDAVSQQKPNADAVAARMHDLLLRPAGVQGGEALIIVAHDVLHYVPFQALRDGDKYVIETSAMSYAPSASALAALLRGEGGKGGRLLAFGNPDLGNPELALPGAQREVDAIKALFPEQESYYLKEATKQRLLAGAAKAGVIHLAAHAEVDRLDPLYSRIYLAPDGADRGTLEAREIYSLNLRGSSLVTLSACESGLGKVSSGDEVWGFTRSLLSAGAPALLVSLWPVADASTERLMTSFYQNLGKKTDTRESLRLAQLDVMRDPQFAHPFFWAPFDLIGNWR